MPFMHLQSLFNAMINGRGLDNSQMSNQNVLLLFSAMVCILAPLELSQLCFALIGALVYAVLQAFNPKPRKTNCQLAADREQRERDRCRPSTPPFRPYSSPVKGMTPRPRSSHAARSPHSPATSPVVRPDVYQPSSMPVCAPKFESIGWEAEVSELVSQLTPGADEDQAVQRLVAHVRQSIQALFADVEVTGFAHGSLKCGKAFGVAVPEVDIVANLNPVVLAQRLQARGQQVDVKKLHKSAIRTCTDRLVSHGGFKFRRSAFRGEEPRVTLLVPASLGLFTDAIPIDFSINSVVPFYTAALLTECGQMEARAKALILLVKRWSKDRGICHAAKGHLSPYSWSLLAMYFMQVGVDEEGPLLPALESFKISSNLMTSNTAKSKRKTSPSPSGSSKSDEVAKISVAKLFCSFVHFYNKRFDFRDEAISIKLGKRAPPSLSLPLHVIISEDGNSRDVGPSIEDPFKTGNNLGNCMNTMSLKRLREELARADDLCVRGASLTELLQPWVPVEDVPERSSSSSQDEGKSQKISQQ